jgi:UDP:flavonoid glycosyltransferase YjiC (YdhE family)
LLTQAGEYIAFYQVHKPFRNIRKKQGLLPTKNYLDELEGDINLICDLVELFPQEALPPDYALISPLYYEANTASEQLTEMLDKTKKTIFVSMGSTGDWNKVRFLNHPFFQKYNLVAAGDADNALHAAHIIKSEFVNTQELFPFTDLVICHGGNGTIYQSLAYGIPVLCKTNHFEQEWNVDALERFKLGKSLDEMMDVHEYIALVAEWIDKKAKGLGDYPKKIQLQRERLAETINIIAFKTMEYTTTTCN